MGMPFRHCFCSRPRALCDGHPRVQLPLEGGWHVFGLGTKPVSVEAVEEILSRAINHLEPTPIRNDYDAAKPAAQFNATPTEMKAFFVGTFAGDRTQEMTEQVRAAAGSHLKPSLASNVCNEF